MSDYCKQCSIEIFGEDYKELANVCKKFELAQVMCEGCGGSIIVNYLGVRQPMEHDLKILPAYYEAVLNYTKRFEIRAWDRPYQVGDTLWLKEYKVETKAFTGRSLKVKILFKLLWKAMNDTTNYLLLSISEPKEIVEAK